MRCETGVKGSTGHRGQDSTRVIFVMLLAVIILSAQDITGKWTGVLSVTDQMGQAVELRLNFNISTTDNGYTSTMDSPDQNAYGMVDDTNIKGTLTQAGQSNELNMNKEE